MLGSIGRRYLTATRYALLGQAKNRMAIILLIAFVPIWYYINSVFVVHRDFLARQQPQSLLVDWRTERTDPHCRVHAFYLDPQK